MNELGYRIIQLAYFMAPAYLANMAPPFLRFWRWWNPPINESALGNHKTVLGFLAGVVAAVLVAALQANIAWSGGIINYRHWLMLGILFGIGAMLGDCIKSYFKRRVGIAPGKSWIPFDQLDYVFGSLAVLWHRVALSWLDVIIILAMSFIGHIVVSHVGYVFGVRRTKW